MKNLPDYVYEDAANPGKHRHTTPNRRSLTSHVRQNVSTNIPNYCASLMFSVQTFGSLGVREDKVLLRGIRNRPDLDAIEDIVSGIEANRPHRIKPTMPKRRC